MVEKKVTIKNKLGMHARPAALLVQTITKFHSNVFLKKDSFVINARSIMSVMMLAAEMGSEIVIQTDGVDEVEVAEAIEALINSKFNEE